MKALLLLILLAVIPARAAMDITRELVAPDQVVPGQPLRIAVTFWTDSWFNPPPQWPDFKIENGSLLTTPLPNQLLSRQKNGISWSGVRLERQVMAWDQGLLRLPAVEVTLSSPNQAPVTVQLPELEKPVAWPEGVEQPDRFLPASNLTLSQKITQFHAGDDGKLHAGDVIERTVTVKASGVLANQIPQLLYAIPGTDTQRLTPVNTLLKSGRGDVEGALREERLRYLPSQAGTVTLPPVKLRWWDTARQQWQVAELPGSSLQVMAARAAGSEAALRGTTDDGIWRMALLIGALVIIALLIWFTRRLLWRSLKYLRYLWRRFWEPVALPELTPTKRGER
ncbi:oxygen tolerance domain protein [Enterobacteriaceae bacterium H20N1]|uniref:Oxygen tolerance domain protein n=1 Tax=Dryocola boscaweniae TaxID=2925397 RepID=A0A9X2W3M2_9ENTR|nr:oxygen tolerance domain protein [Dryocola boscaweniae]MCT4700403.1 oxygen tolerance domain protein [Dryocola boscaweniae]MCT4714258.1 oxygen tolerance domain protein [Dryocola boscaweniae]MCT4721500.1 oxygen tolerance domain protein [Dryocola boscaweniae]